MSQVKHEFDYLTIERPHEQNQQNESGFKT